MTAIQVQEPRGRGLGQATALSRLHREIAALRPQEHAWSLLLNASAEDVLLSEGVIARASDPESRVLMSWDVYARILRLVGAPPDRVKMIEILHSHASRAALREPTGRPNHHPRASGSDESLTRLRLDQHDGEGWPTPAELAAIRSEQDFMDHLRALKVSSGLGLRRIAHDMEKADAHQVLSKSALGDLFRKSTMPRNPDQLRVLLHVLLRTRHGPEFHPRLVDRYIDTWRTLRSRNPATAAPEPAVVATRRDFVANVSHELKTPVGALALLAETVLDSAEDPQSVRRFTREILHEASQLGTLVTELIALQGAERLPELNTVEAESTGINIATDTESGLLVAEPELAGWNVRLTKGRLMVVAIILLIIFTLGVLAGGMVLPSVDVQ